MSNSPLAFADKVDVLEDDQSTPALMPNGTVLPRLPRVAIHTLGCKVNQSETEQMLDQFRRRGFRPAAPGEIADVCVVNTCTVTHIADRKSRQLIRRARGENPDSLVVVTGCYASTSGREIEGLEEVDLVIPKTEQPFIAELAAGELSLPPAVDTEGVSARPAVSEHHRTRAFVKIQDGCDAHCTYCIVPTARGASVSFLPDQIMGDIRRRLRLGYKEIVLTGVHIGRYGADIRRQPKDGIDEARGLLDLVRLILEQTGVERLRFTSIEPMDFDPDLLALWADSRLARHLHLPLQSGSNGVLDRMGRHYSTEDFAGLVEKIRAAVPGIGITTDVIVGFPGETDEEFEETRAFVRQIGFSKAHIFPFSPRRGTPAAWMPGQVCSPVKKERAEAIRRDAEESAEQFRRSLVGSILPVLFEKRVTVNGSSAWTGLTDNYLRVTVPIDGDMANCIRLVSIVSLCPDGLLGHLAG